MKRIFFYTITAFVLLTMTSCEEEPLSQMTLTVTKKQVEINLIGNNRISSRASIDWGDETSDNFKISRYSFSNYTHIYLDTVPHTITITGNNITSLFCNNNQLIDLDVSKNTQLNVLCIRNNPITSLDVSKNTALEELFCGNDQLTNLDVSKNTALQLLFCDNNQLMGLDVSKNKALRYLDCSYNQLDILDVSENTALDGVDCTFNNFSATALNTFFKTLRKVIIKNKKIYIYGNHGTNKCNITIAERKGWRVITDKSQMEE